MAENDQDGPWARKSRRPKSPQSPDSHESSPAGSEHQNSDQDRQDESPWQGSWGNNRQSRGGNQGPWGSSRHSSRQGGGWAEMNDFQDLLRKLNRKFGGGGNNGNGGLSAGGKFPKPLIFIGLGVAAALWLSTGFYRVEAGQRGIELVFGKFSGVTEPGLRYNIPSPLGEVYLPYVDQQRRMNIGFRSDEGGRGQQGDVPEESLMLTSDENIVDLDFTVFWKINDAEQFLFNIRDPEITVKVVAESAMREVVGQTSFDLAVTRGREEIERQSLEVMQRVLDSYSSGIRVERVELQASDPPKEVIDAFNDVQRARQDRDRMRNEAEAYANSIVPTARGQAERVLREAEAYREQLIQSAIGEGQRFTEVYKSYQQSPQLTRDRMYLETIGQIYAQNPKIILDQSLTKDKSGVVPYLPLQELLNPSNNGAKKAPPKENGNSSNN